MKTIAIVLSSFFIASVANACPTCYGALADQSPPFFSKEAYTPFSSSPVAMNDKKGVAKIRQANNNAMKKGPVAQPTGDNEEQREEKSIIVSEPAQ